MASNHEQRITALHETITASESHITELTVRRQAALATDDDTLINRLDSEIETHRKRIQLNRERISVAEQAAREEAAQHEQDRLDAIAARSDKARKVGESLISDYEAVASKLAAILAKLGAVDSLIADGNRVLLNAGRSTIASPNAIRCRAMSYVERTERKTVGVGEPSHPLHSMVEWDANNTPRHCETREPIAPFGEFDVTVRDVVPMVSNEPLQTAVQLPCATVDGPPIWPRPTPADTVAIFKELGLADAAPSVLKRVLKIA